MLEGSHARIQPSRPPSCEDIHSHVPSKSALRVKALESLLVEKRMLDPAAIDAWIEIYRDEVGPKVGARAVARAWNGPRSSAASRTGAPHISERRTESL